MHSVAAERDAYVNPFRFTPGQIKKSRILPLIGLLCREAMCACDRRGAGQTSHCCLPSSPPPPFDLSISLLCNPPLPSSILSSPRQPFCSFRLVFPSELFPFVGGPHVKQAGTRSPFFPPILFSIPLPPKHGIAISRPSFSSSTPPHLAERTSPRVFPGDRADKGHLSEPRRRLRVAAEQVALRVFGRRGNFEGSRDKAAAGAKAAQLPKMYWPFSARCCDYRERLCSPQNYFKSSFGHIEVCLFLRSFLKSRVGIDS